jgi:rhodanese-related sulfurtransferase
MNSMDPAELIEQIDRGTAPVVIDVRSKKEFDEGHVPGAIHLPFWKAGRQWRTIASGRELPVIVYCGHGPRAYIAGAALKRRGFTRVAYLAGHMKRWMKMHLRIEGR